MIDFHRTFGSAETRRELLAAALMAAAALLLAVAISVALVAVARGGCNIPPPADPMTGRRDDICAALRRGPECVLKVRRTVGGHVEATETDFLLYIGGSYVGQFPIVGGMVVDPADLNTELVRRSLMYRMGDAEVRQRVKRAVNGRVAWVSGVLDWEMGRADVEIAVGR